MAENPFGQKVKAYLKRADLSQAQAARRLNCTTSAFNKWVQGVNAISPELLGELVTMLGLSSEEAVELFKLTGHKHTVELVEKLALKQVDATGVPIAESWNIAFQYFDPRFFLNALRDWGDDFFRWSEAPDDVRSSWDKMVLYSLASLTDRIQPYAVLVLSITVLLWLVTEQLATPILHWPLDHLARGQAPLRYAIASWFIPLLVASITPPYRPGQVSVETPKQYLSFWLLKFLGALVGFWAFSLMIIIAAIISYYCGWSPLPDIIQVGLVFIPLFFSYIGARSIPANRLEMFGGELRYHSGDRSILAVFLSLGPVLAIFLYSAYPILANRMIGPMALLIPITGVALLQYRQQNRIAIPDPALILISGVVIPQVILLYVYFETNAHQTLSGNQQLFLGILSIYFFGWTLFGATVVVRQQGTVTLPGALSMLALAIVAIVLMRINRWWGGGYTLGIILFWLFWGQQRLGRYFWIHPSFWVMAAATIGGIYLALSNIIPLWLNGLSLMIIAAVLTRWVYQSSQ